MKNRQDTLLKQNKRIVQQTAKMQNRFGQAMKICKTYQEKYMELRKEKVDSQEKIKEFKRATEKLKKELEKEQLERQKIEYEKLKIEAKNVDLHQKILLEQKLQKTNLELCEIQQKQQTNYNGENGSLLSKIMQEVDQARSTNIAHQEMIPNKLMVDFNNSINTEDLMPSSAKSSYSVTPLISTNTDCTVLPTTNTTTSINTEQLLSAQNDFNSLPNSTSARDVSHIINNSDDIHQNHCYSNAETPMNNPVPIDNRSNDSHPTPTSHTFYPMQQQHPRFHTPNILEIENSYQRQDVQQNYPFTANHNHYDNTENNSVVTYQSPRSMSRLQPFRTNVISVLPQDHRQSIELNPHTHQPQHLQLVQALTLLAQLFLSTKQQQKTSKQTIIE
eukprot:UN02022